MIEDLAVGAVNMALSGRARWPRPSWPRSTGGLPLPPGLFGG